MCNKLAPMKLAGQNISPTSHSQIFQCTSPNAKEKFQQISIAYTKIISAQSVGGKRLDDGDSDEDNGSKRGDESHEMAAFMRMFMDLVGIFNEDQSLCEDGKIPAAG